MKANFLLLVGIISTCKLFAQTIDVAENTLKVGAFGEEVFYYGFAEGDQVIFNFEEMNGKELKELEIIELPSSSKFMDYKTKKVENKTLNILNTGIYKFRFANSALSGRICKFKIQRIPVNPATKNFNTNVFWRTVFDTTYTTEQERYLVKCDTTISNLTDRVEKVHSNGNMNGNKSSFNFTLPENTVAWSYYIGVDQSGQQAFDNAAKELASKASPLVTAIPGYGPLAAVALGSTSYIAQLQRGEDIDYYIVDNNNARFFEAGQQFSYYKKGKVINDFSRMTSPLIGSCFVCLMNDNAITGVNVTVKITAIQVKQVWDTRPIQKMHVASRQEPYLKN
jgi:hypothetical protein